MNDFLELDLLDFSNPITLNRIIILYLYIMANDPDNVYTERLNNIFAAIGITSLSRLVTTQYRGVYAQMLILYIEITTIV